MKILEVRRHAKRFRPSEHLAQVGVTHARRVGEIMRTFSLVISSTLPRAYETAIAMGFAVDRQEEWLSDYPDMIEEELPYPVTFANTRKRRAQTSKWRRIVGIKHNTGSRSFGKYLTGQRLCWLRTGASSRRVLSVAS
jgi:phosphohistidine phosphatase SixA